MNFQNIFLGVLAVAVIAAIVIFAQGGGGSGDSSSLIKVTMWGDVPISTGLNTALADFNQRNQKKYSITYTYIKQDVFESKFIESIADSKAPDLLLISNSKVLRLESKLQPIPYTTIPLTKFDQTYIEASKIFLGQKGVIALPLVIDPVVMYLNHDMFANASIINGPKYWDDIINLQPKLTKRGEVSGTFDQSAIALGEFENITHAKDIISTILLQTGIPIVQKNAKWENEVVLNTTTRVTGEQPIDSALRFYIDFSNPLKTLYSWNRTQPASFDSFIAEKLSMYIGRSSDYKLLKERNPHLKFDLSPIPQLRDSSRETTYAEVIGVSLVKASKQQQNALIALSALASDDKFITNWSKTSFLPPARKDLLTKPQSDLVMPYFYDAAIKSKSWLDPKEDDTTRAFKDMINGLSSGRFQVPSVAANFLEQELNTIVNNLAK